MFSGRKASAEGFAGEESRFESGWNLWEVEGRDGGFWPPSWSSAMSRVVSVYRGKLRSGLGSLVSGGCLVYFRRRVVTVQRTKGVGVANVVAHAQRSTNINAGLLRCPSRRQNTNRKARDSGSKPTLWWVVVVDVRSGSCGALDARMHVSFSRLPSSPVRWVPGVNVGPVLPAPPNPTHLPAKTFRIGFVVDHAQVLGDDNEVTHIPRPRLYLDQVKCQLHESSIAAALVCTTSFPEIQ
jgi:hypothetical protein